jgi:spore coat protein U-like protein
MTRRQTIPVLLLACTMLTARAFGTATCGVNAASTAFGVYDSLGNNNDDTLGSVTISCTGNIGDPVNYSLALSSGQSGSFASRTMSAGAAHLGYNLYLDAGHTTIWGDGTSGTSTASGSFNLAFTSDLTTVYVYGRVYGGQNSATVSPGYSDSIVITLTY